MSNMLLTGLAWAAEQKKAHASSLVTYSRDGVGSAEISAELGKMLLRVTDNDGNVRTERADLTIWVNVEDLEIEGAAIEPKRGDHIDVTLHGATDRYDVMPMDNEPAFTKVDLDLRFRIHAKHISTGGANWENDNEYWELAAGNWED